MGTVGTPSQVREAGKRERVGYIDAMKGFLAICVVLGHIADGYLDAGMYPEARTFLYNIYNLMYSFHMPMFMMVSGYVFYTAYFDREGLPDRARIIRQVWNLAVIYLIFCVPMGLIKIVLSGLVNKSVSLLDVALIPVKPIAPYWYLYSLLSLYLIFLVSPLLKRKPLPVLAVLGIVSVFSNIVSIPWFSLNMTLFHGLFFYVGISYSKYRQQLRWKGPLTAGLFAAAVLLCVLFWNHETDRSRTINQIFLVRVVAALGISLALWYAFEHIQALGNNKFLRMCGRYSLEIYVIHCYFTAGLRSVFPRIGLTNAYLSVAVNLVVSLSVPILFALLCKKLGIHGLLFKPVTYLSSRRKARQANPPAGNG